jgi:uncharacterized RDD family membrane protein YckC
MGYAQVPLSPQGRPLASWGKRLGAALIDGLVIGIPSYVLMAIVGFSAFQTADFETDQFGNVISVGEPRSFILVLFVGLGIVFALGVAYAVYFNGSEKGQTVGKMALKIQVRDENTGGPIGYGRAFVRWLVTLVLLAACWVPGLVDALFPLWDPKRQTIHDKAASSLVVDTQ